MYIYEKTGPFGIFNRILQNKVRKEDTAEKSFLLVTTTYFRVDVHETHKCNMSLSVEARDYLQRTKKPEIDDKWNSYLGLMIDLDLTNCSH